MAKIPTYRDSFSGIRVPSVDPGPSPLAGLASGFQEGIKIGSAIKEQGERRTAAQQAAQAKHIKMQADRIDADNTAFAKVRMNEIKLEVSQAPPEQQVELYDSLIGEMRSTLQELPSDDTQKDFDNFLDVSISDARTSLIGKAIDQAKENVNQNQINAREASLEMIRDNDVDLENIIGEIHSQERLLSKGLGTPAENKAAVVAWRKDAATEAFYSKLRTNPYLAKDIVESQLGDSLDAETKGRYIKAAEAEIEKFDNKAYEDSVDVVNTELFSYLDKGEGKVPSVDFLMSDPQFKAGLEVINSLSEKTGEPNASEVVGDFYLDSLDISVRSTDLGGVDFLKADDILKNINKVNLTGDQKIRLSDLQETIRKSKKALVESVTTAQKTEVVISERENTNTLNADAIAASMTRESLNQWSKHMHDTNGDINRVIDVEVASGQFTPSTINAFNKAAKDGDWQKFAQMTQRVANSDPTMIEAVFDNIQENEGAARVAHTLTVDLPASSYEFKTIIRDLRSNPQAFANAIDLLKDNTYVVEGFIYDSNEEIDPTSAVNEHKQSNEEDQEALTGPQQELFNSEFSLAMIREDDQPTNPSTKIANARRIAGKVVADRTFNMNIGGVAVPFFPNAQIRKALKVNPAGKDHNEKFTRDLAFFSSGMSEERTITREDASGEILFFQGREKIAEAYVPNTSKIFQSANNIVVPGETIGGRKAYMQFDTATGETETITPNARITPNGIVKDPRYLAHEITQAEEGPDFGVFETFRWNEGIPKNRLNHRLEKMLNNYVSELQNIMLERGFPEEDLGSWATDQVNTIVRNLGYDLPNDYFIPAKGN